MDRQDLLNSDHKEWVKIDPIQCFGNPWEIDWVKNNQNDNLNYPKNLHSQDLSLEEIEIIKNYYNKQGIQIHDLKIKWTYDVVCEACNCPKGYTLYLQISKEDVDKMLELGYTINQY